MLRLLKFFLGALVSLTLLAVCVEVGARLVHTRLFGVAYTDEYVGRSLGPGESALDGEETFDPIGATAFADEYLLHPYLGFVSDPRSLNFMGKPRFSRFGFSGADMPLKRAQGEFVVAVMGGSVAHSLSSSAANELGHAVERRPAFAGKKVRIVSLALPGYKQPQQLMALTYFLSLGAEFDAVVNLDGFNEITLPVLENLPRQSHPIYPRSWNPFGDAALDKESLVLLAELVRLQDLRQTLRQSMAGSGLRKSAFAFAVWEVRDHRLQQTTYGLRERWNARMAEMPKSPLMVGPSYGEAPMSREEVLRESIRIWRACSLQMARLCEANGILYTHFLQPNQYVPGSKPFSEEEKRIAYAPGAYKKLVETGYPQLQAEGERLRADGVPFVDLTDIYEGETRSIYIDPCCHVGKLGEEIMAEAIAEHIAARLSLR